MVKKNSDIIYIMSSTTFDPNESYTEDDYATAEEPEFGEDI